MVIDFKWRSTLVWERESSFWSLLSTCAWEFIPFAWASISAILALISSSSFWLARTSAIFLSFSEWAWDFYGASYDKTLFLYFSSMSSLAYFWSSLLKSGLMFLISASFYLPASVKIITGAAFSCWTNTDPMAGWIKDEDLWSKTDPEIFLASSSFLASFADASSFWIVMRDSAIVFSCSCWSCCL